MSDKGMCSQFRESIFCLFSHCFLFSFIFVSLYISLVDSFFSKPVPDFSLRQIWVIVNTQWHLDPLSPDRFLTERFEVPLAFFLVGAVYFG